MRGCTHFSGLFCAARTAPCAVVQLRSDCTYYEFFRISLRSTDVHRCAAISIAHIPHFSEFICAARTCAVAQVRSRSDCAHYAFFWDFSAAQTCAIAQLRSRSHCTHCVWLSNIRTDFVHILLLIAQGGAVHLANADALLLCPHFHDL